MPERRRFSRFRIPWLLAPSPSAAPPPPRPAAETQSLAEPPISSVPIQSSPFRPSGTDPVQSPSTQSPCSPRDKSETRSSPAESQSAPTHSEIIVESLVNSKPESPPHEITQSPLKSPKPSPSLSTKNQASSLPPSPTRESLSSGPASLPPSPSPKATSPAGPTTEPVAALESNHQKKSSSDDKLKRATDDDAATKLLSVESGYEKKEIQLDGITKTQENLPPENTSQPKPNEENKRPEVDLDDNQTTTFQQAQATIKRTGSETTTAQSQRRGQDLVSQESQKEEKTQGTFIEKTITELPTTAIASEVQAKEIHTTKAEEKKHREDFKRKILTTKSIPGDQDAKFVGLAASNHMIRNASIISQQRPSISSNGEGAQLHKGIREDISKFVRKMATGHSRQPMDDKPVSVVTLAGDNKGATMHLSSESGKKEESIHIYRGYRTNPDESPYVTTDGERSFRRRKKHTEDEEAFTRACLNNNTQGINNSILSDGSIHERDPGVHLILPCNPAESIKSDERLLETRKSDCNITPAERQTYQPVVRRRCLRGLFLESSDSDPDNPNKPRRHGCRYNCTRTDKDIGIL